MPKLTRERLRSAKYVSMADFAAKLDQIESFEEKMEFTALYLLSHGRDGAKTDYTFDEAVHIARMKLSDESKRLKDKLARGGEGEPNPVELYVNQNPNAVDPYAKTEKDDIENQFFMGHPAEYLKGKADQYIEEIGEQDVELDDMRSFRENCERLSPSLNAEKSAQILSAEAKGQSVLNIKARMEQKYRSREYFERGESSTRPSWFTRVFRTRSTAGKNFDEAYAAFNDPKSPLYGDKDALKAATAQYLDYKASKRSAAENAVGLRVREPKEGFAERLLDAIETEEKNAETFKSIVEESAKKPLTQESVDKIKGPEMEEHPSKEQLILDLDEEEESLIDDSVEEDKSISIESEKEADGPVAN